MPGIGSAPKSDLDLASSASEQVLEVLRSKRKTFNKSKVMLSAIQFMHLLGRCWYPHSSL